MRNSFHRQRVAPSQNVLGDRRQPVLKRLRFQGTKDPQAHGRRRQASQMLKKQKLRRARPAHAKLAGDSPKDWSKMPKRERRAAQAEGLFHHGRKRASLKTAGAVGHMVGEEGIAKPVQCGRLLGRLVRLDEEGQAALGQLKQAGFQK